MHPAGTSNRCRSGSRAPADHRWKRCH